MRRKRSGCPRSSARLRFSTTAPLSATLEPARPTSEPRASNNAREMPARSSAATSASPKPSTANKAARAVVLRYLSLLGLMSPTTWHAAATSVCVRHIRSETNRRPALGTLLNSSVKHSPCTRARARSLFMQIDFIELRSLVSRTPFPCWLNGRGSTCPSQPLGHGDAPPAVSRPRRERLPRDRGLPLEIHELRVEPVDHPWLDPRVRRPIEPKTGSRNREQGSSPPCESPIDEERDRTRGGKHRRVDEEPELPEELPVANVLDLGEGQPLLVDRRGDDVALPVSPA